MKPSYIFHSGFLVETHESCYIFDYYKGGLPELDRDKPVAVFVSHAHQDHCNMEVFRMLREQGVQNIQAVISKDVPSARYPQGIDVVKAYAGREYRLPGGEKVETLLSTDCGVAYILTTTEGSIYHAGDLNDWTWEGESDSYNRQMRGSYRHEIDKLTGRKIDIAFLPLDPRQGPHSFAGISYFLDKVRVASAYPMHYWEQPGIIGRFLSEHPQYAETVKNTEEIKL